jgi:DnaJ-class molecular chaperone
MTEKQMMPCEACRGTGGFEMNGGQSMSNEYFECELCDGTGEVVADENYIKEVFQRAKKSWRTVIDGPSHFTEEE